MGGRDYLGKKMKQAELIAGLRLELSQSASCRGDPKQISSRVVELASHEARLRFQRDRLGVWVGGVVLIDPFSRTVRPLFAEASSVLPYTWHKPKAATHHDLINSMFAVHRLGESLRVPLEEQEYPPEYSYYSAVGSNQRLLQDWEWEVRTTYGCHYVPLGEVLFFLIVWRFLVRLGQSDHLNARSFLNDLESAPNSTPRKKRAGDSWLEGSWLDDTIKEKAWMKHVQEDADLLEKWRGVSGTYDRGESASDGLTNDLVNLGLYAKDGRSSKRSLKHLGAVRNYILLTLDSASRNQRILGTNLSGIRQRFEMTRPLDIPSIVSLVMSAASLLLGMTPAAAEMEREHIPVFLNNLHRFARFPILPYFYWCVIDSDVKCHLTFPVWESFLTPYETSIYEDTACSSSLPSCLQGYGKESPEETQNVAFAVLGVRPLLEFDWTLRQRVERSVRCSRFDGIRSYYETLARPLIDAVYYFSIQQAEQKRLAIEHINQVAGSRAHRLMNQVAGACRGLQELDMDCVSLPDELQSAIDWAINGTQQARITAMKLLIIVGERKLKPQVVDFLPLVHRIASYIKGIEEIEVAVDSEAGAYVVYFSEDALECVLEELICNSARHAAQSSLITIRCTPVTVEQCLAWSRNIKFPNKSLLLCEVSDNGHGIPNDEKKRIFEDGFSKNGQGVGLAVSQKILRTLGTDIWEDGHYGKSARFRFVIPIKV